MAKSDKSLRSYRRKRDFQATPEPAPGPRRPELEGQRFVVHRHEARNLHYDLRLEVDGALKSFAIPRGFSYDPSHKRLAVRTEDHPLEYLAFEGVIPKGEYGAGTMTIWDLGHYHAIEGGPEVAAGVEDGKLEIVLRGRRLRGEWHLVRTKADQDDWLLFKKDDHSVLDGDDPAWQVDFAAALEARAPGPMRSRDEVAPFSDAGWLFEMEFDGRRLRVEKDGDAIRLLPAKGRELARQLPRLVEELGDLRAEHVVLDAVLVALDEHERPDRAALDARLKARDDEGLCLYVFDVPQLEGWNLGALPLRERKKVLRSVVPELDHVLFVDHVEDRGAELCQAVEAAGLPGVIAKAADSGYAAGPSKHWCRIPVQTAARSGGVREALESRAAQLDATRRKIRFTNREKVYWPEHGLTKGDLIDYYEAVSSILLPYLRDRPLHLNRFPDGIHGESFYQKNTPTHYPDWISTEVIPSEGKGKPIRYTVCNEVSTLLYLANTGSIDLHPWLSRLPHVDHPDWFVIDLDPKEAPFKNVVVLARTVGKVVRGIGLRAYLKTSGATGLHIFVPLAPRYSYEQARMFAEGIARYVVREHPDIATVERNLAARRGKVYVDFLQNRKGQTIVPPYSVRPVPGAQVSAPLDWDELDSRLHPGLFTIETMPERLASKGDLFDAARNDPQDLMVGIEGLERLMRGA